MDAAGEPLAGAAGAAVEVMPAGAKVTVSVSLKAEAAIGPDLYADVSYPSGWHAAGFEAGAAFGGADRWISLAMLEERPVKLGICLVGENRDNPPTGGELFNLVFTRGEVTNEKAASKAPVSAYNVLHAEDISLDVTDLDVTFEWREKNRGDYDRDGVVAINDITPIAVHFGKTLAQDPDSVDLVDGSGNNRVGIEDITPIAVNFGGRIEGYRIWRSDLAAGQYLSNLQDPARPELSATRPNPDSAPPGRLQYSYTDTAPDDTVTYVFYPYGDGQAGVASDVISPFSGSGDTAPPVWVSDTGIITAELQAGPQIRFTFGKATDADSPPVRYVLYWQEGAGPMNFGTAHTKVYPVADGEIVPYVRLLQASDGVQADTMYSLCVRARDNVGNGTTNTNYLTVGGGSPDDFTPPEWTSQAGIISATPGDGQVSVTWGEATDADSAPVTYLLWYAEAATGIDWGSAPQATYPAGTLAATVSSLTNDVEYEFGIRARDSSVNLNTTTNTNTLMATPTGTGPSPFPFGMPPEGEQLVAAFPVTDTVIATDSENHPAIVSVDKAGAGINFHYYDETGSKWVYVNIDSPHRFYHPALMLVGDQIYVVAFDGNDDELVLYTGTTDAQEWVCSVIDDTGVNCYELSAIYDSASSTMAVAAAMGKATGNEEVTYYYAMLGLTPWSKEVVDNSQPNISGVSLARDPQSGEHCLAYANGVITGGSEPSINVQLRFARRTGADDWDIETLHRDTNTVNAEAMDLAFDPAVGLPRIAMTYSHEIDFYGTPVPITDAVVAEFDGEEWDYRTVETRDFEVNGVDFYFYFAGADPQISYANGLSFGSFVYVFVEAIYWDGGETLEVRSSIKESYHTSNWSFPLELSDPLDGASADSLEFKDGSAQICYAAISTIDYGPARNNYPEGDLTYYREP